MTGRSGGSGPPRGLGGQRPGTEGAVSSVGEQRRSVRRERDVAQGRVFLEDPGVGLRERPERELELVSRDQPFLAGLEPGVRQIRGGRPKHERPGDERGSPVPEPRGHGGALVPGAGQQPLPSRAELKAFRSSGMRMRIGGWSDPPATGQIRIPDSSLARRRWPSMSNPTGPTSPACSPTSRGGRAQFSRDRR